MFGADRNIIIKQWVYSFGIAAAMAVTATYESVEDDRKQWMSWFVTASACSVSPELMRMLNTVQMQRRTQTAQYQHAAQQISDLHVQHDALCIACATQQWNAERLQDHIAELQRMVDAQHQMLTEKDTQLSQIITMYNDTRMTNENQLQAHQENVKRYDEQMQLLHHTITLVQMPAAPAPASAPAAAPAPAPAPAPWYAPHVAAQQA